FGYPGRIDNFERVWLTLSGLKRLSEIRLNGQQLACEHESLDCREIEITHLLQKHNELVIEMENREDIGELLGEVALEVRRTAFLRSVKIEHKTAVCVRVSGLVVGQCDEPLEIYVLFGRRNIGYAQVRASEAGCPFEIEGSKNSADRSSQESDEQHPD